MSQLAWLGSLHNVLHLPSYTNPGNGKALAGYNYPKELKKQVLLSVVVMEMQLWLSTLAQIAVWLQTFHCYVNMWFIASLCLHCTCSKFLVLKQSTFHNVLLLIYKCILLAVKWVHDLNKTPIILTCMHYAGHTCARTKLHIYVDSYNINTFTELNELKKQTKTIQCIFFNMYGKIL